MGGAQDEEGESNGMTGLNRLSRRERQIMDVVYELGQATVQEVQDRLSDPPSYSAVRAMMRILEEKGRLVHKVDGHRYVYQPTTPREEARRSALAHLMTTFFDGNMTDAVATLLDIRDGELSEEEYARLKQMIEQARAEGR